MFHEKLSSSYRRWLFGWRTTAWPTRYCLAGALLLDRCGALLLGRRTAAGIGARRGRLAAAVRIMRRRRRPCFWLFCGASSCSKRSRV